MKQKNKETESIKLIDDIHQMAGLYGVTIPFAQEFTDLMNQIDTTTNPDPILQARIKYFIDKFPKTAYAHTLLSYYYTQTDDNNSFVDTANAFYKAHRDCISAKNVMAMLCLTAVVEKNQKKMIVEQVFKIYNPNLEFLDLPHDNRTYFIKDYFDFYQNAVLAWVKVKNILRAKRCLGKLEEIRTYAPISYQNSKKTVQDLERTLSNEHYLN